MRHQSTSQTVRAVAAIAVLLAGLVMVAPAADAQNPDVVINEIVAANDSYVDNFGATPDWIELQNNGGSVNLAGWTVSDDDNAWVFPSVTLGSGQRIVLLASNRDLASPRLHTNFSLKRTGETITLADPDGLLVDAVSYPELDDDQAYGRGSGGGTGFLLAATPLGSNTALAPSTVNITTPPQAFEGNLSVTATATVAAGEQVRYTTNGNPVTASSSVYSAPISISTSTVVRMAVAGNGVVGPESSAGYIAVNSSIANFSSDVPIVLVHSTGAVSTSQQDAVISVIDRGPNGRASVAGPADYTGFAGLNIRGATSVSFDKKQYKLELWGNRFNESTDANLLGLGSESDWGLYAPGRYDRAMINNPFMYELAKRAGVLAPDYQFVEVYLEDNGSGRVGSSDYLGLFVLRESIKIGDNRVDITKHTPTSAGPSGGYIFRYDWSDTCCANLEGHPEFGSQIAVHSPDVGDITNSQYNWADSYWDDLQAASRGTFAQADALIDFDSFIDGWLLMILAMDVDLLRASHYMHKDVGGQLRAGPFWDFDRALGGADIRIDSAADTRSWNIQSGGHSYQSDIYDDLWDMPEVQARLRARWAELRQGLLSEASLNQLVDAMGAEISEAYVRENDRWGSNSNYGPRFGGGLSGELAHMKNWLDARASWVDGQFLSGSTPPNVIGPAGGQLAFQENVAFSYQVQATDSQTMVYSATGLPVGFAIDEATGVIAGTVAYGDGWKSFPVSVTVTDSSGAATTISFDMVADSLGSRPSMVMLNEFNAVAPGKFLVDNGSDASFGRIGGNGGDWFEIVTREDNLDLRGWRFDLWSDNDLEQMVQTAQLVLSQDDRLSDIRAGSIITVAESVPDDLSYDPAADDWTMNLQANSADDGALWANQTNFDVNHQRWRLVIRDATGDIAAVVAGETDEFRARDTAPRVTNDEVYAVLVDPSRPAAELIAGALDTSRSTFGSPNDLGDGTLQDFSLLRPMLVTLGDVNCSSEPDILDALTIAQYSVGNRVDSGGCPLADPLTEINLAGGDANDDGNVDILDALTIAQCSVGIPNGLCPEP